MSKAHNAKKANRNMTQRIINYTDPTGETATNNVMKEQAAA